MTRVDRVVLSTLITALSITTWILTGYAGAGALAFAGVAGIVWNKRKQ